MVNKHFENVSDINIIKVRKYRRCNKKDHWVPSRLKAVWHNCIIYFALLSPLILEDKVANIVKWFKSSILETVAMTYEVFVPFVSKLTKLIFFLKTLSCFFLQRSTIIYARHKRVNCHLNCITFCTCFWPIYISHIWGFENLCITVFYNDRHLWLFCERI